MKILRCWLLPLLLAALCSVTVVVGAGAAEELPRPLAGTAPGDGAAQRYITIDFDNVDINLFIKYISELTGKNFVVDRAVQGNVTIISPTRISEDEAYRVFESVLEVHGFTTVPAGSVTKILPSARARSQNLEMLQDGASTLPQDRVVTQLVPLQHSSPEEIKKVLTPLVSQTSVLIAHVPSGMLIITETLSNIQKLLGIITLLDVESREAEVDVITLEKASAPALAKILASIYQQTSAQQRAEGMPVTSDIKIVPYERVNALIVLANASEMDRVRALVARLDTEVPRAEGNIHVYYLQNATAVELVKVLNVLPEKTTGEEVDENVGKAAAISRSVRVMADAETNSLIITASRDEYAVLEEVIGKLDIPRRMVYLEALIMEVDADKTFDVGVQWAAGGSFDDGTGQLATGFSGPAGFDLLPGISSNDPSLPSGFSFGVLKQGIQIGGVTFPNIAAVLRAYKTDSAINIISTPQILTTDNKKAEISVGQNVPFITSRNTTASEQDYTQYEYKDVATKLSIVPHINQADALRLEIETEVVRIKGDLTDTPTTFKRTASTTVVLNDQDTIVIGGIIGHDATESEWKVPLLGDIPGLGWLFKTRNTTSTKTNMFIFVTPRIVRNPAELAAVAMQKEDAMGLVLPGVKEAMEQRMNPDHARRLIDQGQEKLRTGRTDSAEQYFAEARRQQVDPGYLRNLIERGYDKLQAGQTDAARVFLEEALTIEPSNPYALINMAAVYEKSDQPRQAAVMYQAVIAGGTAALADRASAPERLGVPLLQIAREGLERLAGTDKPVKRPESNTWNWDEREHK